jgi:uncharacterized protein YqhQ
MMLVRPMHMAVHDRFMHMLMGVLSLAIMAVSMVHVMPMGMRVHQPLVSMPVTVSLGHEGMDAYRHQRRCGKELGTEGIIQEQHRHSSPYERAQAEEGRGAR